MKPILNTIFVQRLALLEHPPGRPAVPADTPAGRLYPPIPGQDAALPADNRPVAPPDNSPLRHARSRVPPDNSLVPAQDLARSFSWQAGQ
jgi:hypothetical protein